MTEGSIRANRSTSSQPTASLLAWPATMRIEALSTLVAVVWLTAVLCPRLTAANNLTLSFSSQTPREHPFREHISSLAKEESNKWLHHMQMILREEKGNEDGLVECCPTKEEMVEPLGGINQKQQLVTLYRHGENRQRFFEYSCKEEVVDQPCRFVDRKLYSQSRCVQKYSYTYAIIETTESEMEEHHPKEEHRRHKEHSSRKERLLRKEHPPRKEHILPKENFLTLSGNSTLSGSGWSLDYIKVRSGCSCELIPKPKKKKKVATKARKVKSKLHHPRDQETDFET